MIEIRAGELQHGDAFLTRLTLRTGRCTLPNALGTGHPQVWIDGDKTQKCLHKDVLLYKIGE